jgi:hypothetical protein
MLCKAIRRMEDVHRQQNQPPPERVTLHCSVTMGGPGQVKLQAVTENLGSDGFYCILADRPQLGELFETEISLSTGSPWGGGRSAKLLCLARVREVDVRGPHIYGVEFSIENYTIAMASA